MCICLLVCMIYKSLDEHDETGRGRGESAGSYVMCQALYTTPSMTI